MNKKVLAATIIAALTLSAGAVFASPVDVDGTAKVQYRYNSKEDKNGFIVTTILDAKTNVDKNVDFYFRGAGQLTNDGFGADYVDGSKDSVGGIDKFGFVYANKGFTYQFGRQDATVGATALLYNNNYKIGPDAFVDGLTVTGKSGVTDMKFIAAQEDNKDENNLYALHASYSPAKDLTVGATVAKYDAVADSNHWAVDAAYNFGKATISGEFTKSDADNKNKAYDLGVAYAFDSKNSAYVINYKVEDNGDINAMTDFDPNYKGFYYGFDHKMTKDTTLSVFYKDIEELGTKAEANSFRTTVTYKF